MKKFLSMFIILAYMVCMIPVSAGEISETAQLKSVTADGATLSPAFSPNVLIYDVIVDDKDAELPELDIIIGDNAYSFEVTKEAENLGDSTLIKVIGNDQSENIYKFTYRAPYEISENSTLSIPLNKSTYVISNSINATWASTYAYVRTYKTASAFTYIPFFTYDVTDMDVNPNGKFELTLSFYNKNNYTGIIDIKTIYPENDNWTSDNATFKTTLYNVAEANRFDNDTVVSFDASNYANNAIITVDISEIVRKHLSNNNYKFTLTVEQRNAATMIAIHRPVSTDSKYYPFIKYYPVSESSDAAIKSLKVTNGLMDKKFSPDVFEYNIGVNEGKLPEIKYILSNSHANVKVTENEEGKIIEVTSQNKKNVNKYQFNYVSLEDAGASDKGKLETEDVHFSEDELNAYDEIDFNVTLKNMNLSDKAATVITALRDDDSLSYINITTDTISTGTGNIEVPSITLPSDISKVNIEGYIFDTDEKTVISDKISVSNVNNSPSALTTDKAIDYRILENEGKIKFYGKGDINTNYTFFVTYPGMSYENLEEGEMSSILAAFDVVKTNEDGIWGTTVKVPENISHYKAYVYDGKNLSDVKILYASKELKVDTLEDIYDIIYSAETDEATIKENIKAYLKLDSEVETDTVDDILGLDSSVYNDISVNAVINILYTLLTDKFEEKPEVSDIEDIADFSEIYNKSVLISKLNAGIEAGLLSVINEMGFSDLSDLYDDISVTRKDCVDSTLLNNDLNNEAELYNLIKTNMLLEIISNPENVSVSKNIIENYGDYLELDLTKYNKITNKSSVIQTLVNEGPYSTKKDLNDNLVKIVKSKGKTSDGGSGGGSGGGSTGGGSFLGSITGGKDTTPVYTEEIEASANQKVFTDIEVSDWTYIPTKYLSAKGIISGTGNGKYEPNRNVSREEFAKIISVAFNLADNGSEIAFNDVSADSWYYEYVKKAVSNGAILGISETEFGTGVGLKRQDAAVILMRVMGLSAIESDSFSDDESIADYAKEAVYTLKAMGVLNGTGEGNFEPERTVTRGECAKIIYELIKE